MLIDTALSFSSYIRSIFKTAFYHLKNISKLKGCMLRADQEKLNHAFISSRFDYCSDLPTELPKKSVKQLQLIRNAAARVLTKKQRD